MRVRAANPSDAHPIARVHVDTWRTTYTGIVPAEYLAGLSYRDRESRWEEILAIDQPTVGGTDLVEVSYGWRDVAGLVVERGDSRQR